MIFRLMWVVLLPPGSSFTLPQIRRYKAWDRLVFVDPADLASSLTRLVPSWRPHGFCSLDPFHKDPEKNITRLLQNHGWAARWQQLILLKSRLTNTIPTRASSQQRPYMGLYIPVPCILLLKKLNFPVGVVGSRFADFFLGDNKIKWKKCL